MVTQYEYELDPATFITVGAKGPPGQRTFYLQAAESGQVVSLAIEKEQAAALAASIERLLAALEGRDPEHAGDLTPLEANMSLLEPVEPEFRVAELGIGLDEDRHLMIIVAHEAGDDEPGQRARFVATYQQMLTLSNQALEVVNQGRPVCELCGEPMDPDGHFCPRRNGHHTI